MPGLTKERVVVLKPQGIKEKLGKGSGPIIRYIGNERIICVWENEKQIHSAVLRIIICFQNSTNNSEILQCLYKDEMFWLLMMGTNLKKSCLESCDCLDVGAVKLKCKQTAIY